MSPPRLSVPTTSMPWREEESRASSGSPSEPFVVDGHVTPPPELWWSRRTVQWINKPYFADPFAF